MPVLLDTFAEWPRHNLGYVLIMLSLLAGAVWLIHYFLRGYTRKQDATGSRKNEFLNFARGKGLKVQEMKILENFYESLEEGERESLQGDQAAILDRLYEHIAALAVPGLEERVRILSRLFGARRGDRNIVALEDIEQGEVAGLKIGETECPVQVSGLQEPRVKLLASRPLESRVSTGEPAGLYFFRPGFGGFDLSGVVLNCKQNQLILELDRRIGAREPDHIMARLQLALVVMNQEAVRKKSEDQNPKPGYALYGTSRKISERALEFRLTRIQHLNRRASDKGPEDGPEGEKTNPYELLKKYNLWVLKMRLADGYNFVSRGKLTAVQSQKLVFLFRFLDLPETARKVLVAGIKENNPEPEQMG